MVDIIVSNAAITGVQFVLSLLASAAGINIMDHYFMLFGLLLCFVAAMYLIHTLMGLVEITPAERCAEVESYAL